MENTEKTTIQTLVLKALRPSIENNTIGIELRKKVMELGGTDLFQYSLKQLLLFRDMVDHSLSSNNLLFLKEEVTEKEIESCIKIASSQPTTVSFKIMNKVLMACPRNKWFKPKDISVRTEDSERSLNALFIIGQLKKRGSRDEKEYFLEEENSIKSIHSHLSNDSQEIRVFKVLKKLESFGTVGTRLGIQAFLKENKCPSYTRLSGILRDSGHIIKDSNRKKIIWNIDKVGKPNLSMATELLRRGKSIEKNQNKVTLKSKHKTVSENNFFDFLYTLSNVDEVITAENLKSRVSEFVKEQNLTNKFKEFYIKKELGDKLSFLE